MAKAKQSAIEQALNFVRSNASNAYSNATKTVNDTTSNISKGFGDFYNNFSKDYDTFRNSAIQTEQQAQKRMGDFANKVRVQIAPPVEKISKDYIKLVNKNPISKWASNSFIYNQDEKKLLPSSMMWNINKQSQVYKDFKDKKISYDEFTKQYTEAGLPMIMGLSAPVNSVKRIPTVNSQEMKLIGSDGKKLLNQAKDLLKSAELETNIPKRLESLNSIKKIYSSLGLNRHVNEVSKMIKSVESLFVNQEASVLSKVPKPAGYFQNKGIQTDLVPPPDPEPMKLLGPPAKQPLVTEPPVLPKNYSELSINPDVLPELNSYVDARASLIKDNARIKDMLENFNYYNKAGNFSKTDLIATMRDNKNSIKKIDELITSVQSANRLKTPVKPPPVQPEYMQERPYASVGKTQVDALPENLVDTPKGNTPLPEEVNPNAPQLLSDVPTNEELALKQLQRNLPQEKPVDPLPNVMDSINPPIDEVSQVKGNSVASPTQTPEISPQEPLLSGQKERGLISSIKENPTIEPGIRQSVSGNYDTTTDAGRIAFGREAIKNDFNESLNRVLSNTGDSNELDGLSYALFHDLQEKAMNAKAGGNSALYGTYRDQATQVLNAWSKRLTPHAQSIQFAHLMSSGTPASMVSWAQNIFDDANKFRFMNVNRMAQKGLSYLNKNKNWELSLSPELKTMIEQKMKDITIMPEGAEKIAATKQLMDDITKKIPVSTMAIIDAYRYQNMLSGTRTHLRNIYSNLFNGIVLKPIQMLDAAFWDSIGSATSGKTRTRQFSEIPVYYRALFGSLKEATLEFKTRLANPSAVLGKSEDLYDNGLSRIMQEKVPGQLKVAGSMLEGADGFFTVLIQNGEYARLKSLGVADMEAKKLAEKLTNNILYREKLDPKNLMGQGSLLSGIDRITQWIMDGRKVAGPLGWMVPFVRVPMAVAKMGLEYNPLTGPLTAIGADDVAAQMGKARIGTYIMGLGAVAASAGGTTWAAPTNEKLKKKFYDTGRKPFSFSVRTPDGKEHWIPMSYLGPLALPFALPAAMHYFWNENKTADTDSFGTKAFNSIMGGLNMWSQTTPLQGLGGFVRTAQGDVDYSVINNLAFSTGQMIPLNALMGDVTRILDPVFRKPKGFIQGIQKNIPVASTRLEPITNSLGTPAVRNASDYVMPYSIGEGDGSFEDSYKNEIENQQDASLTNYYKKLGEESAGGAGTASDSSSATLDSLKVDKSKVDTLLKAYNDIPDPQKRQEIKALVEKSGVKFDDAMENYMMKDIKVKQKGLSDVSNQKLQRSNEYTYLRKLRDQFDGTGIGEDFLNTEMKRKGVSIEDLQYDDKTALPDDVQLDEIKSFISDLSGEQLIAVLTSFRKVSEGTRKPLLTDTLIGKLEDEGIINKSTSKFLQTVQWDGDTNQFKQVQKSSGGGSGASSKFKITVPKSSGTRIKAIKPTLRKISLKPVKTQSSKTKKITLNLPKISFAPLKVKTPTSSKVRVVARSLKGLGKSA